MPDLVSALLGGSLAVAGGAGVAILTFKLNASRGNTEYRRQKLEELYLAADEFHRMATGMMFAHGSIAEGKVTWNEMNEQLLPSLQSGYRHGGRETIDLLISVYFPGLLGPHEKTLASLDRFNEISGKMKCEYQAYGKVTGALWQRRISKEMSEFVAATGELKREIVREARSISGVNSDEEAVVDG